jgi:hypothetical protein
MKKGYGTDQMTLLCRLLPLLEWRYALARDPDLVQIALAWVYVHLTWTMLTVLPGAYIEPKKKKRGNRK